MNFENTKEDEWLAMIKEMGAENMTLAQFQKKFDPQHIERSLQSVYERFKRDGKIQE